MKTLNLIFIVPLFFLANLIHGQDIVEKAKVSIKHRIGAYAKVKYSDTLTVCFDGGFNGESIMIEDKSGIYRIDSLQTNPIWVLAGVLQIPKIKGKHELTIFVNGEKIKKFRLKKRFSSMHFEIDRKKRILKCEYWKRVQNYI